MAAGIMNDLLGVTEANTCAASERVTAVTLTRGTKTGAANIDLAAIGGDIYVNYGSAAAAGTCVRVIASGTSYLIPIDADPYVIEKDGGAKWAASYWK